MRKFLLLAAIILAAGALAAPVNDARLNDGFPIYNNPFMPRTEIDYSHSFAPMVIDSIPPFPAYHNLPVYTAGVSFYDMQHNTTKGRNVAVDPDGGVHVAWMNALDEGFVTRRVYYNYFDPDSGKFICAESTGVRTDSRARAGYTTISVDDSNTVPTVAFHDMAGGSSVIKANAAIDGTYYATLGEARCSFIPPLTGPDPYIEYSVDVEAIWPVVAQIDTNLFIVSTPSVSDTTIGGHYYGQKLIYYRGFVKPIWGGYAEMTFEPAVEIEDDQIGITCDITTYNNPAGNPEVAMAYVRHDTVVSNDTCYCTEPNYYTTIFDAAALMVRRSTDMGETWSAPEYITEPGVHIYSDYPESLYLGWYLDTLVDPPETVEVYVPVYSRPIDCNIVYDSEGYLHATWTGAVLTPHEGWEFSCEGVCSTGAYCQSIVYHWDDNRDELDTVIFDPIYRAAGCPPEGGLTHLGYSYEPQVAVDDSGVIFVFWEQMASEFYWAEDSFYLDVSENAAGYMNSEIWGACYDPIVGYWSDPLLITNTYSTGCAPDSCWSEIEVTIAERIDDYIHLTFFHDTDAGLAPYEEGETTLGRFRYLPLPTDSTRVAMYEHRQIGAGIPSDDGNHVPMPSNYRLGTNYPNPFNAATMFWFDVYEPGHFTIDVIDMNGRIVKSIVSKDLAEGRHRFVWEGFSDNGWLVPSGVYFLRAKNSSGEEFTRKITLMK